MTELELGQPVYVKISTENYGVTLVTGIVVGFGYIKNNPDGFWFQIAGLTNTFYSDEVTEITRL